MTKLLEIKSITKKFYGHPIIKDLSFDLSRGQIMSIIGPSGSGKSTILRILSGLEQPTDGSILMNGKEITAIKANKRNISLVFQDSLLFPHMTIEENVSYGGKLAKKKNKNETIQLLEAVGMEKYKRYYPSEISGGQQQRVALARAMATEPEIILFDEPFSNLDINLRQDLRRWVRNFLVERNMTAIFVTHDIEEAMLMSEYIAIFHNGIFQQYSDKDTLYKNPNSSFIAHFIGGHLIIDETHYAPFSSCKLNIPENQVEFKSYEAVLKQFTYQHGQKIGYFDVNQLNQNISLPIKNDLKIEDKYTIYIEINRIESFSSNSINYL